MPRCLHNFSLVVCLLPIFSQFHTLAQIPTPQLCGTKWQKQYSQLHRAITAGDQSPSYVVGVSTRKGLADRLIGAVTALLLALITDRAVLFEASLWPVPALEQVYNSPHINWTSSLRHSSADLQPLVPPEGWANSPHSVFVGDRQAWDGKGEGSKGYFYIRAANTVANSSDIDHLFRQTDLTVLLNGYETVLITTNRGVTAQLFSNPFHSRRLLGMGLQPATTFGCLLNFLFKPQPAVLAGHKEELRHLSDRTALKIGIQVRAGDAAIKYGLKHRLRMRLYQGFFDCAQQVEDAFRLAHQPVVWYLVTDSLPLRQHALQQYSFKLLSRVDLLLEHTSKERPGMQDAGDLTEVSQAGLYAAAAENWLLGMTNFQVITRDSGYGRTAAFRSLRNSSVYTLDLGEKRRCGRGQHDALASVLSDWSGI